MEKVKSIILLRHGETGLSGKYVGCSDVDLHPDGTLQILESRQLLRGCKIEKIYCSPLLRCRQTLELLSLNVPVEIRQNLQEVNFGQWEGRSSSEIADSDPDLLKTWGDEPDNFVFPGGESIEHFRSRVKKFWEELKLQDQHSLLIISHGGVIRTLLCLMLELPFEKEFIFAILPGRFAVVRLFQEGAILEGLNLGGKLWQR